eukprot:scaffold68704_cov24-Prasinocladus_malaysianus.AAC.1
MHSIRFFGPTCLSQGFHNSVEFSVCPYVKKHRDAKAVYSDINIATAYACMVNVPFVAKMGRHCNVLMSSAVFVQIERLACCS